MDNFRTGPYLSCGAQITTPLDISTRDANSKHLPASKCGIMPEYIKHLLPVPYLRARSQCGAPIGLATQSVGRRDANRPYQDDWGDDSPPTIHSGSTCWRGSISCWPRPTTCRSRFGLAIARRCPISKRMMIRDLAKSVDCSTAASTV
jgi:hypothetical protein